MEGAYNEYIAVSAMDILGIYFDYAINYMNLSLQDTCTLFLESYNSECMEFGDARVCLGMSGIEFFDDTYRSVYHTTLDRVEYEYSFYRSPEYWFGWTIAHYQWYSCLSFKTILNNLDINWLLDMYIPLHQQDEQKTMEMLDSVLR